MDPLPGDDRVTEEMDVLRWRDGLCTREPDVLAVERLVTAHVEPLGVLDIIMSPDAIEEFVLGHLFCEGLLSGPADVAGVTIADRGDRLDVLVELDPSLLERAGTPVPGAAPPRRGLIQTECGAPPNWPVRPLSPIEGRLGIAPDDLRSIPATVRDLTGLFQETGAFHYAFLVDARGRPLAGAHDVGRHTAVDKAVGQALKAGLDPGTAALYTTGRISSDVARKCLGARMPLVASRGAPLAAAVEMARANSLGVVGFLRGGRFNVYAGEHHIDWG